MKRSVVSTGLILIMMLGIWPGPTQARTDENEFVRSANIFLWGGPILDQSVERLSHFDLLVLPVETQVYNKTFFPNIRKLNPDIIILAYVATVSWNDAYWSDP